MNKNEKIIILTMVIMSLLSTTVYAESVNQLKFKNVIINKDSITAIVLYDTSRHIELKFEFYDKAKAKNVYKNAVYEYDYVNDVLIIKDKQGNIVYNNDGL